MKILVVVQRYGAEVVGGSESHARVVAHRLAMVNEVEVATTNALDYWSWAPHFPVGESMDGPVRVRRFGVTGVRSATFKDAVLHAREIRNRYTFLDLAADAGLLEPERLID